MKIGYFADGVWAHKALDKILTSSQIEVAFIVARFDRGDPILRLYAERLHIPYLLHENVNKGDFMQIVRGFAPDLNVSMSFNQILGKEIRELAPLGFINCHAGALPFYRGRNILNWALINGETQFGVTVHHVDEGIDTGDIILQRFAPIGPDDTYSILLEKAVTLCAEVLFDSLHLLAEGKAPRIVQSSIHPVGFYCSRRGPGDELLDWFWSSQRIHNFIRGISPPGPGARTFLGTRELALLAADLNPQAPAYIDKVGAVVGRTEKGCLVKTGDTTITVTQIADVNANGGLDNPRVPSFSIGTVFRSAPK
jgi:methionyl-tRNA formyltransferase